MLRTIVTCCTLILAFMNCAWGQTYTHSLRNNTYQHLSASKRTFKDTNSLFDTMYKTSFAIPYFGKAISDSIIVWGNSNFAITEFEFDDEASAFGADLSPRKDGKSYIAQTTDGSSPNRIFKIEWGYMGFTYDTLGFDSISYQVWFYEQGGIIEYHYGPSSVKNPFSWNGETGPYAYLVDYNGTTAYGLKGNPASPVSYSSFVTGAGPLTSVPAANSIFRFAPAAGNAVQTTVASSSKLCALGNGLFELRTDAPIRNIQLLNTEGKTCLQGNIKQFSIAHLPAGLYLLQIETSAGRETLRLINP